MLRVLCFLTLFLSFSAFSTPHHNPVLEGLLSLTQPELDALYGKNDAGPMVEGESQGEAILFPGRPLANPAATIASLFWQGKIFDVQEGIVVNRVFGIKAIKAKLFFGTSQFDGRESIIIDYKDTSLLVPFIRDEVREIAPKVYLGRAYFRQHSTGDLVFRLNFALDFNQAE